MITLEAMGLDNAQALTEFYLAALAEYSGCHYGGTTRSDGLRNTEVLDRLANPDPRPSDGKVCKRDLRPFSDSVAAELGEVWKRIVEDRAERIASAKPGSKITTMDARQQAKAASAAAWRAAGLAVQSRMQQRAQDQLSADDSGQESAAEPVSDWYAKQRKARYGVDEGAIYKASGQLLEDLSPNAGRIVLDRGLSNLAK
jgi:hypothetical protein